MRLFGFRPCIARGQYRRSAGRIEQQERLWEGAPLFQPDNQRGMACFVSTVGRRRHRVTCVSECRCALRFIAGHYYPISPMVVLDRSHSVDTMTRAPSGSG